MKNLLFLLAMVLMVGCSKEDPCTDLFCVNGECVDGRCECPGNYVGIECSIENTPTSLVIEAAKAANYPGSQSDMNIELFILGKDGIPNTLLRGTHIANNTSITFTDEFEISNNNPEIFVLGITATQDSFLLNRYDLQNTLYEQDSGFPNFINLRDGSGSLLLDIKEYRF